MRCVSAVRFSCEPNDYRAHHDRSDRFSSAADLRLHEAVAFQDREPAFEGGAIWIRDSED